MNTPITITFAFETIDEANEFTEAIKLYRQQKNPLPIKSVRVKGVKVCRTCGKDFELTHCNRQEECDQCKAKKKIKGKRREPISKTLKEIKKIQAEREKQPYQFGV